MVQTLRFEHVAAGALLVLTVSFGLPAPGGAVDQGVRLYFCPNKPEDQQYRAAPAPGCTPLVEDLEPARRMPSRSGEPGGSALQNAADLEKQVAGLLARYNGFLACCARDPHAQKQIEELDTRARELLAGVQQGIGSEAIRLRGHSFYALVHPLAQVRRDLADLKKRLWNMGKAMNRLPHLDYEAAARAKRRIAAEMETIRRDFKPIPLPTSPDTGMAIEDTSLPTRLGTDVGHTPDIQPISAEQGSLQPRTGPQIGDANATGPEIGQTPQTGMEIGGDSGPSTYQPSLPPSPSPPTVPSGHNE